MHIIRGFCGIGPLKNNKNFGGKKGEREKYDGVTLLKHIFKGVGEPPLVKYRYMHRYRYITGVAQKVAQTSEKVSRFII